MNWLVEKYNNCWDLCVNTYHVDPVIFLVLYVVKSVIFWWLTAVILKRALKRQWEGLALLVTINAAVDVVPWVYVWIWGDNHPWWYQYMVYIIGGWGFVGVYLDIRRKTKKQDSLPQVDQAPAEALSEKQQDESAPPKAE
ncbi:MAG: hypothetical protein Q4F00_12875 [bacterium]|nr:hypothetical protein [bacterium]